MLPIPFALNCRTLNVLPLVIVGEEGDVGDYWVGAAELGSQDQSLLLRYCGGYIQDRGTWKQGLCSDERHPPSDDGAGVGFGPVVVVVALWS